MSNTSPVQQRNNAKAPLTENNSATRQRRSFFWSKKHPTLPITGAEREALMMTIGEKPHDQLENVSLQSSFDEDLLPPASNKPELSRDLLHSVSIDEPIGTEKLGLPTLETRTDMLRRTLSQRTERSKSTGYCENSNWLDRDRPTNRHNFTRTKPQRPDALGGELLKPALTRGGSFRRTVRDHVRKQINSFFQVSDNKLAMKLFGNSKALNSEKVRHKQVGFWIIHPCSKFRFYWDIFMLLLLLTNLVVLPVVIAFFFDDLSIRWIIFNCVSDTMFLLDICINFRTGIILSKAGNEILLQPSEIARHYLRSWFCLDLISSLPIDYIFLIISDTYDLNHLVQAGRALRILRLTKLLSLLRLLRLSRLVRYVQQWQEFLNMANMVMRVFNLICFILLLAHWNGCLQFFIPMLQDYPNDCWVSINELKDSDWFRQYTFSVFKALSHMLCIGYGQRPPVSSTDMWLTIVSMVTGATCYAIFVGHMTTLIGAFDSSKRLYREKLKQVQEYTFYRKLPKRLRDRVTDYYEHRFQGKCFNEDTILGELNECLREEIIGYNCRQLVAAVPFFAHADPNFVSAVVTKLRYEVFQPGDYIIKEGTVGDKMYFIQLGEVDIVTKSGLVATTLSDGSYFGGAMWYCCPQRCRTKLFYRNLLIDELEHFNSVLEHYPVMRKTLKGVAAERLHKLGRDPKLIGSLGDLSSKDIEQVNEVLDGCSPRKERATEPDIPTTLLRLPNNTEVSTKESIV